MKKNLIYSVLSISSAILFTVLPVSAEEGHEGHDHAKHKGHEYAKVEAPHGGKMLEVENHHVEYFVTPERKAVVRFYDHDMKPVTLPGAQVQVITRSGSDSTEHNLIQANAVFVTEESLPDLAEYSVVLRIRISEDATFKNTRIQYNAAICEKCQHPEYACTCEGQDH